MKPFQIGDVQLSNNILFAPLAGCSDLPYRQMALRWKPGIFYCEMVKIDALVRNDPHTFRLLDYTVGMHPIGAQLCGSKPKLAAQSAKIIEDLGFDVLDLNCGCPVDKVTKDGSGSGLLKTPELIGEILAEMIAVVKIPVTLKIRAGWDEAHVNAEKITQIAEKAGAKAITVHGRTRAQGYKGPAVRDHIRRCKLAAKNILVIGNGDIFDADSAIHMFEETKCDGILIARGAMGQPWIVEDILRKLEGRAPLERDVSFIRSVLLDHFECILKYQSERQALLDMRRVGCWYLKRLIGVKDLRIAINRLEKAYDAFGLIQSYDWDKVEISSELAVVGEHAQ